MSLITLYESNNIRYEFDPERKDMVLGRGGMGVVFKGRRINSDTQSFEYVAIKGLFRDLPDDSISRARREASIQIEHENLLRMYSFLEARDGNGRPTYHVVSEYLDGIPLIDVLKLRGRFSQNEAISIVKKMLSALNMLHEAGYIHRDIDPSNIMICNGSGRVKLIDFGIAKRISEYHDEFKQGTIAGRLIGKIKYASPEQACGDHWNTNKTSDIYSTGIMLYHLICGKLPFDGVANEIIKGHQCGVIHYDESVSASLRYVINKATAKLQKDRYESASEFIVDLEKIENGKLLSNKKSSSRWLVVVISSAMLILVMVVGGIVFSVGSKRSNFIEQAESRLSVGLYQESLELYKNASLFINSRETKRKISMLKILVSAVDAYNKSDSTAVQLFKRAAEYGSADAYYYLGEMNYEGIGALKNYDQGLEYTLQAIDLGCELAKYRLGVVYRYGLGEHKDEEKALKYFKAASKIIDDNIEIGNPEHITIKGKMYLEGNHIQQSTSKAIVCFTEAAELNYAKAQYELYLVNKDSDYKVANKWLSKAVGNGYPKAEYDMSLVYWKKGDYENSLDMLQRAASKKYSLALQTLGVWYSTTQNYAQKVGLERDNTISHNYTRRALESDCENVLAMYDMWSDFSKGNGVAVDYTQAIKYKRMALDKLNNMPYRLEDGGRRVYYSHEGAQAVWDKLLN